MFIIPLRQLPDDKATVLIDGSVYKINTVWNSREAAWYVSIFDVGDNPLILGQKLIQTQIITKRHGLIDFIDGDLWCINTKSKQSRPVFEDLGLSLQIAYLSKQESTDLATAYSSSVIYN